MGRDEMGDEFRCFLVALFAWYVGPLACKTIVSLSRQDFEWMSWILNGNRPWRIWRQLLRVILTLEDFTHPEFCVSFAQASRKQRGSWPLCPTETGSKMIVDSPYWVHFATMFFLSGTLSKTTARTGGIQGRHCWQNRNCVDWNLEVEKPPDKPRGRETEKQPSEPRFREAKKPKPEIIFVPESRKQKMHQISGIHLRARSRKLSLKNWPRANSHCGRARISRKDE